MELYALRDISTSDPDLQEVDIYYLEGILQKGKGCTRLLRASSSDGEDSVAIKLFPKTGAGHCSPGFLTEERSVLKLSHPNLVKYHSFYKDALIKGKNDGFNQYSAIIMEYISSGDLFKLVSKDCLSEKLAKTLFRQMISVIEYLHTQKLAHLDLKLENFLINETGIKLIDFDGCQKLQAGMNVTEPTGTCGYRPPEFSKGGYQDFKAADVYSLGIVLFTMVTGTPPYTETQDCKDSKFDHYYEALRKDISKFWKVHEHYREMDNREPLSQDFKTLIQGMLTENPQERWSMDKIKRSKWYEGEVCTTEELKRFLSCDE